MNRSSKLLAVAGAIAMWTAADVMADITLSIYLPNITPRTGTAVVLVDAANDGFGTGPLYDINGVGDLTFAGNPSAVNTQWSPDDDDVVIGIFNLTGTDPDGSLDVNFNLGGLLTTGDRVLFVFYPNLPYSPTLTGPGPNQPFGFIRDNLGGDPYGYGLGDAWIGWTVPADGAGLSVYREEDVVANFVTIPEPTAGLLVGLSALGLMAALRRRTA